MERISIGKKIILMGYEGENYAGVFAPRPEGTEDPYRGENLYSLSNLDGNLNLNDADMQTMRILEQEPAIGTQAHSTYFPGANHNINKGYYQGQTFSAPIFAAGGGLFPQGVVDARQKAIQDAALKRQQEAGRLPDTPQLNNALYQRKFEDSFFDMTSQFWNEAKEQAAAYGIKDPRYLLEKHDASNPNSLAGRYQTALRNYQGMARGMNQGFAASDAVLAAFEQDPGSVTKEAYNTALELKSALGQFEGGQLNPKDLNALTQKLQSEMSFMKYFNSFVKPNVTADVTETIDKYKSTADYDLYKEQITEDFERQKELLAENMYEDGKGMSSWAESKEAIKKRLEPFFNKAKKEALQGFNKTHSSLIEQRKKSGSGSGDQPTITWEFTDGTREVSIGTNNNVYVKTHGSGKINNDTKNRQISYGETKDGYPSFKWDANGNVAKITGKDGQMLPNAKPTEIVWVGFDERKQPIISSNKSNIEKVKSPNQVPYIIAEDAKGNQVYVPYELNKTYGALPPIDGGNTETNITESETSTETEQIEGW